MTTNLREQILQRVRSEIISGFAPPGTMYSVPTLADSLGTSSTPVREALLELVNTGLLEPLRNRGFKVTAPSVAELQDIFNMRELLEVHAARLVAQMPEKDLSTLPKLADRIAEAVKAGNYRDYLATDRDFHQTLIEAAGSPILTDTVMSLRSRMRLFGINSVAGLERQLASVREHYTIIELANSGKADELATLLKTHIRSWEPVFMQAVADMEEMIERRPLFRQDGRMDLKEQ
jgi:DNA-binding GntR family transcriptional regulator